MIESAFFRANVKGDSRPPEGERGDETALPNDGGNPTHDGAGVDVHRLVRLGFLSRAWRKFRDVWERILDALVATNPFM